MLARKIILGFGFAIVIPLLIHYGVELLLPAAGDREYAQSHYRELRRLQRAEEYATAPAEKAKIQAQIDLLEQQQDAYESGREARSDQGHQYRFFIGVPLGIVAILIGSFVRVQAVGGGLMLGGIFTFTEGCYWYWTDLQRLGKFSVLLAAFVVLLWIGYQRFSELKQPAKPS